MLGELLQKRLFAIHFNHESWEGQNPIKTYEEGTTTIEVIDFEGGSLQLFRISDSTNRISRNALQLLNKVSLEHNKKRSESYVIVAMANDLSVGGFSPSGVTGYLTEELLSKVIIVSEIRGLATLMATISLFSPDIGAKIISVNPSKDGWQTKLESLLQAHEGLTNESIQGLIDAVINTTSDR